MYQDPYRQQPSYPSPYGAPPPSYNNDLSHLKILSIGHYVLGALTALFTAYLNGRLAASREQFIDYCVELLLTRAAR